MKNRILTFVGSLLCLLGFADALYLTIKHYQGIVPICSLTEGCDEVLTSSYATLGDVPIALFGTLYYLALLVFLHLPTRVSRGLFFVLVSLGLFASLGLTYLQFGVLQAICVYCLGSAMITFSLWIIGWLRLASGYQR
ncbi:vitamin K epoxide reductase family protein [Candidatus Berkelbacteria bacterium]|nr:vitamin K epoxide reductase family protein [Candidatus Berkelbacteria bacterium]